MADKTDMANKADKTDKILKVIFNGISTLVPGAPRNGDALPEKAFVLMAANRVTKNNDWGAPMERHFPFVYVPVSLLAEPIPAPLDEVDDEMLGRCNIYFLDNARITFDRRPSTGIDYYIDRKHDLGERPGSDDVASEHDVRWLADMRDIVDQPRLQPTSDPRTDDIGPEVAAIVDLPGGMIKANFPCKSVQPKVFQASGRPPLEKPRRVLASEFFIEMSFSEKTREVPLRVKQLRKNEPTTELAGTALVLKWPERMRTIVIRMGNDTRNEIRLLSSVRRCDARTRGADGRPVIVPRDDDFFLHYELFEPKDAGRPLPLNGPHQTEFDGCKPLSTGGPP